MSFEILRLFSFSLFSSGMDFEGLEDDNDAELAVIFVIVLAFELLFIMVMVNFLQFESVYRIVLISLKVLTCCSGGFFRFIGAV